MQERLLARRGTVSCLALLLTMCGGGVPTAPTRETPPAQTPRTAGAATGLSARADWPVEVLRAPESGQSFKLNGHGKLPQPAPKFRVQATPAVDIPEGTFKVLFLTAGSKPCGIANARAPIAFSANNPRTIDIPNDAIVVGPDACAVDGVTCTPSQCKFPLTTTRMRFLFGNGDEVVGQATASRSYKWTKASSGGGGSSNGLTCGGEPAPSTVACGVPTARCVSGKYVCSGVLPCWQNGILLVQCPVCPGPFCDGLLDH